MPEKHRHQGGWTPERLIQWAERIGPDTRHWVESRLHQKAHPEQAYRVCLGLLNLSRNYPAERLNASCRIANREGLVRLKQIRSLLISNRDQLQEQLPLTTPELPQHHANIRGTESFH